MDEEDVIIPNEVLLEAREVLKADAHTSRVETLAIVLCILLEGFLDKLIEEQGG